MLVKCTYKQTAYKIKVASKETKRYEYFVFKQSNNFTQEIPDVYYKFIKRDNLLFIVDYPDIKHEVESRKEAVKKLEQIEIINERLEKENENLKEEIKKVKSENDIYKKKIDLDDVIKNHISIEQQEQMEQPEPEQPAPKKSVEQQPSKKNSKKKGE